MADNITHGLAAALLAQAGLRQRYGALATAALLVGSELPDLDALFELGGAVFGFVHHRGITHSLLGGAGLAVLDTQLGRFGLTMHPDTTRLLPCGRPPAGQQRGKGPATCDCVGCTCYWARSHTGRWGRWWKTRRASLRGAKQALEAWCRRPRHPPLQVPHAALRQRVQGH